MFNLFLVYLIVSVVLIASIKKERVDEIFESDFKCAIIAFVGLIIMTPIWLIESMLKTIFNTYFKK